MSEYAGQVVYLESLRYRGRWLNAHDSKKCRFTSCPQSDVIDNVWTKWIVRNAENGLIALESLRYPNNFLDAHHSRTCHVTYSAYPYNQDWALWYLEKNRSGNVCLRSSRYPDSRLDAHHSGEARVTPGIGQWSKIRLYQPDIAIERTLIFTYDNSKGKTTVETKYSERVGISRTDATSVSRTVSSEIGMEIKEIFSAKTSSSTKWEQSSSTTWSAEVSREVSVSINPGTIKKIYQLQGSYGPYTISSNHLFFEG